MKTAHPISAVRINGIEIGEQAIAAEMQYHPAASADQAREAAVRALAVRELLVQEARRQGLTGEPETMIDDLLEREVKIPRASDAECQQYYSANTQRFTSPALLEASHILLAAAPDDSEGREQAREQAGILLDALQRDPSAFAALARDYSACPSKEQAGNLGQLSKGSTVPEFERQVFAASEGLLAYPIESRYGYHVVRVDRKIEGEQLPFELVQEQIRQYLEQRVLNTALSQYVRLLSGAAEVEGLELEAETSPLLQ